MSTLDIARLPDAVAKIVAAAVPATVVLRVDRLGRLLEAHGDASTVKLSGLGTGKSVFSQLPMLEGSDLGDRNHWACIDNGAGHAVDVDTVPGELDDAWIVLVSVEDRRLAQQQQQLAANEARLMNQRQQKLVDQLVAARSELELRRREAEEALTDKTRFIASMSHEFRTPLTSVIGYAEWLSTALDDTAQRQSRAIVRAGRHMLSLVNNLLEQAQLETNQASARPDCIALRDLVEDIAAIMAPLAAEKGLAFAAFVDPQLPERLVIDEMRVRQILINLLGNAVKFTRTGSVQLNLSSQADQLHIEVADTGPGIAEDDKGRIFTAFKRLEGSQRQVGSGLGLHITLQLVKLLGGSIGLDSEIGRGTKFHVRLPYQDAPAEIPAAASEPAAATTGQHLLLAEDDPDLVQLLQLYLARAGYVLTIVDNGRDAVSEALARQPDLVLMDFNLPIVDGLSAACQLREKGYSGVVVALTGATLDDDRLQAVEAGFDGFIAKPIRMPELMATLQALLA